MIYIDDVWKYYNSDGVMASNTWIKYGKKKYYLGNKGQVQYIILDENVMD